MYVCKFKNKKTKRRVIEGGPWIYDKAVLVFDELKGEKVISALLTSGT